MNSTSRSSQLNTSGCASPTKSTSGVGGGERIPQSARLTDSGLITDLKLPDYFGTHT
ncbi:hypothetical protein [Scytonema sp. PCC 10023]|uniref:hypothetical protein n=1 Tax=Scytonema sp. PCC 10023 TaxID=1680591 RepID=UPI0039C68609